MIEGLIRKEMEIAEKGGDGLVRIKLNNLVDTQMIELLYEASKAGVRIQMIIRGVCCLVPGIKGLSENIEARSIVGRYLEHSRFLIVGNGGEPKYYLGSADWMERNLDKRIEAGCPIYNENIREHIQTLFDMLWKGNMKSRVIDEKQQNKYYRNDGPEFDVQDELYKWYAALANEH